jgi:uncharacterized protein YbaR (Trm112 family)
MLLYQRTLMVKLPLVVTGINGVNMLSKELLEILRCPNCVREKTGLLTLHKDAWLVCAECGRKYPILDEIPVMLIDEGDKWVSTPVEKLPVPPPEK